MLAHIQRLVISAGKFFLCFEFVFDRLVDAGAAGRAFDVNCVQISHICLIECYAIFEGVAFW